MSKLKNNGLIELGLKVNKFMEGKGNHLPHSDSAPAAVDTHAVASSSTGAADSPFSATQSPLAQGAPLPCGCGPTGFRQIGYGG